jgi:methyltransferase family protein
MADLIRRVLTRKSRIRDLILEREELAAHLARLEKEMSGMSEHLSRITQERDEQVDHLQRLTAETEKQSKDLQLITGERDAFADQLYRVIREQYHLDPEEHPNFNYFLPGHYYSPIPSVEEVKRDEERIFSNPKMLPGVDLNVEGQIALLDRLERFYEPFPFKNQKTAGLRFSLANRVFGGVDAVFLFAMLRHVRPSKVVEVGSGHSSCLMLDTNDLFLGGTTSFTFIDPNPEALRSLLAQGDEDRVQIIPARVQEIKLDTFATLNAGDILFIDSSHVCKVGSDVNHIFFEVLPSLKNGVYVHIHDIHYPFEYPREWVYAGRAWNEAYLLRAFLQYNNSFQIVLFNALVSRLCEERLRKQFPVTLDRTGGIWLQKR